MKKTLLIFALMVFVIHQGFSQNRVIRNQQSLTNPEKGLQINYKLLSTQPGPVPGTPAAPMTPGLNWEATDAAAIANYAKNSSVNSKTACGWGLNDQRLSVYSTTSTPDWEVPFTITGWDEVIDMTEDGSKIANGVNDQVEVYGPASSVPLWSATIDKIVRGIQIRDDGQQVFVAAVDLAAQDSSIVYCFNFGQSAPVWRKSFAGNYTALVLSKSGNRLLLGEYGGANNKLFVLNPVNGTLIYQTVFSDQYPPAVSDNGKYIVSGDFSGHVFLLEYSEIESTYHEKWNYTVAGSNSWAAGMGISGDGSTIAVGTLIFTATGYDGELYVWDNNSPVPLWVYPNMGDMVQCVDLSYDGSIIAAAGWGPINNTSPDILLFRRQSSEPYLSFSSPGSNFCLDLSADGKRCVAGGKAVHARDFGMGGKLFSINSDLGGGTLQGKVFLPNASQPGGARVEILSLNSYFTYTNDTTGYVLPYIPEGTYTARYSAIGYITQDKTVQLVAGQITEQNVSLQQTGVPPQFLSATQGAGLAVDLQWQASTASGVTGYNIYRKKYSFESFPATPLGTVGASQLNYTDNTALPLTHYYYVVTASLPSNLETPYSNEATGWIATGFVTHEISAWAGTTPVIDGIMSAGEWSDAFKTDISNFLGQKDNIIRPVGSVMAWFKVNAAKTELYVAVDNMFDGVLEDHDEIALYIDDNNDGFYPAPGDSTEGNYWAAHYASGDVIKFRPIYNNGGVGFTYFLANPQIKVVASPGHMIYEFVIPMGTTNNWQIGFNAQSQSGIFIFALDDPTNYDGWWPCDNQNIFTAEGYGVITYGGVDEVPPAPLNLQLDNPVAQNIMLHWDQPAINDFGHFNVYWAQNGGSFVKLDTTIGVQYFLTVPSNGLYEFYVTTVDLAGHESVQSNTVSTNVVIGIDEPLSEISMVKIGPNPFSNHVVIDFSLQNKTTLNITVCDLSGNTVKTLYNSSAEAGNHHLVWNGNDLPAGMYLVRFTSGNGSKVIFKLVK